MSPPSDDLERHGTGPGGPHGGPGRRPAAGPVGVPPPWELGSDFPWAGLSPRPAGAQHPSRCTPWLRDDTAWYASGTGALSAVVRTATQEGGPAPRLHLPSFWCMDVAAHLGRSATLCWYRHLPGEEPDLGTLDPAPGDVVLAVNLFGLDDGAVWGPWARSRPEVVLVEDHTHDPGSGWAEGSAASWCLASLRKTAPVPDGAALWSPAGHEPPPPRPGAEQGASLRLQAMLLKEAWLAGADVAKEEFRALQARGEELLVGSDRAALPVSRAVLSRLDAPPLRHRWADNAARLVALLDRTGSAGRGWEVLRPDATHRPFHVQLVCDTPEDRDDLRAHLRAHRVYAPVHWAQPSHGVASGDPAAEDLAARVLTLPTDHRYGTDDMARVAAHVRAWGA